jgi:hypothetical protein
MLKGMFSKAESVCLAQAGVGAGKKRQKQAEQLPMIQGRAGQRKLQLGQLGWRRSVIPNST